MDIRSFLFPPLYKYGNKFGNRYGNSVLKNCLKLHQGLVSVCLIQESVSRSLSPDRTGVGRWYSSLADCLTGFLASSGG